MAYNRQIPKVNQNNQASQWFRLYLEDVVDSANNLSTSNVSTSSNTITSSTGTLRFNSSGIINFNGLKIDFTSSDEPGVLATNSATYASFQSLAWLGHKPGDLMPTFRTTAPTGWILVQDGTIGNESSNATVRAHQDCEALFVKLWNKYTNSQLSVSGGRGSSGVNDFAAGKTIELPGITGKVVSCSGSGSGLTIRTDYEQAGEDNHSMTIDEMGSHWHYPLIDPPGTVFTSSEFGFHNSYANVGRGETTAFQDTWPGDSNLGSSSRPNTEKTQYINFLIKL